MSFKSSTFFNPIIVLTVCLCLIPVFATLVPRFLAFAPSFAALLLWASCIQHSLPLRWPRNYFVIVAIAGCLCAISALWSIDMNDVLKSAGKVVMILLGGALLFTLSVNEKLRLETVREKIVFPLGLILMSAWSVMLIDLMTNGLIYFQLHEQKEQFSSAVFNRSIIALLFISVSWFWVGYDLRQSRPRLKYFMIIISLLIGAVLIMTQSQTAQLSAIILIMVTAAFPYKTKSAWIGLAALMIAGIMASPFLVPYAYMYADQLQQNEFLAHAYVAHRLEIWDFVVRRALESPLYGHGMEASKYTEHFDSAMRYRESDHVLHPHNFVLQIWLEFGVVGALLLSAFTAFILRVIYNLGPQNARRVLPIFIALFAAASISYGLWQSWWIGLFTLIPVYALLSFNQEKNI